MFVFFCEQWNFTFVYPSDPGVVEKTQISMLIVYLQRSIVMSCGKGPCFSRKALNFEEGVFVPFREGQLFFEIPVVEIRWAG